MPPVMPLAASAVAHLGVVFAVVGHQPLTAARPTDAQPNVSDVQIPIEIATSTVFEGAQHAEPLPRDAPQSPTKRIPVGAYGHTPQQPTKRIPTTNPQRTDGSLNEDRNSLPRPRAGGAASAPTSTSPGEGSAARVASARLRPLSTSPGEGSHGEAVADGAPIPEAGVSVAARLISGSPSFYPNQAREAEIEADVPLEIIVDQQGRVTTAHAMQHVGYGLDDAALRSVRAYRFSPALRGGHPVRVKMRWVVQFRLR